MMNNCFKNEPETERREVPLFDPLFEKLVKEDPELKSHKSARNNENDDNDEPDVIIGAPPKKKYSHPTIKVPASYVNSKNNSSNQKNEGSIEHKTENPLLFAHEKEVFPPKKVESPKGKSLSDEKIEIMVHELKETRASLNRLIISMEKIKSDDDKNEKEELSPKTEKPNEENEKEKEENTKPTTKETKNDNNESENTENEEETKETKKNDKEKRENKELNNENKIKDGKFDGKNKKTKENHKQDEEKDEKNIENKETKKNDDEKGDNKEEVVTESKEKDEKMIHSLKNKLKETIKEQEEGNEKEIKSIKTKNVKDISKPKEEKEKKIHRKDKKENEYSDEQETDYESEHEEEGTNEKKDHVVSKENNKKDNEKKQKNVNLAKSENSPKQAKTETIETIAKEVINNVIKGALTNAMKDEEKDDEYEYTYYDDEEEEEYQEEHEEHENKPNKHNVDLNPVPPKGRFVKSPRRIKQINRIINFKTKANNSGNGLQFVRKLQNKDDDDDIPMNPTNLQELEVCVQKRLDRLIKIAKPLFPGMTNNTSLVAALSARGLWASEIFALEDKIKKEDERRLVLESQQRHRPPVNVDIIKLNKEIADAKKLIERYHRPLPEPISLSQCEIIDPKTSISMQAKITKEKGLIKAMSDHVQELEQRTLDLDKRIALMTQKKSSYVYEPEKDKKNGKKHNPRKAKKNIVTKEAKDVEEKEEVKEEKKETAV